MSNEPINLGSQESTEGNDLSDTAFQDISSLYKSEVVVPLEKPSVQMILCPVGLVGAGKSTVIKPIAKKLSLVRISTDEIRKLLKENGYNYTRVREIAFMIISDYLSEGYSIVIDADCVDREARRGIAQLVEKYRLKTVWIHINPPEDFIIDKLKNFRHTWLFKDAEEAIDIYQKRKPLHEEYLKLISFDFIFDTSKKDLNEQVSNFIERFNNDG